MGCGTSNSKSKQQFRLQKGSTPLPKETHAGNTRNSVKGQRCAEEEAADDAAAAEGSAPTKQTQPVNTRDGVDEQRCAEEEAAGKADSVKVQHRALAALMDDVRAGTLPHTLSLGQPEEAAQRLARLHAAVDHPQMKDNVSLLLNELLTAARHCTGDAALLGRLACLLCCIHRLLLLTTQLDDAGDLSDEKAQWKKAADELRRLCVSRFHSAAQSYGGTALLELHLSQVQLTQVHLPARKVSSQVASAAANVTFGVAKAVLLGSYGTLVKGLGQAVSASIDAVSQQLSQTCFEQLKELSEPPVDDNELENWLQKMHDEHFRCGDEGHWEPKGEGRWEPKAAFSVVLADLVAARPPRLTPQLFEMVCMGGKGFIGLANLMALGSHSAADVDARHAGLVNLTMWAQEVVLQTLESENNPAADTAQPTELPTNDGGWGDGHGLQVLAEELERAIQEGTAMLASSAERLTAVVAEGVSEQVRDVLVCGAREDVVRGKPKAVAALAACNSVLGGVEESLQGVGAAAVACQPLLQLTSKLLQALTVPFPDAIVERVIGRALQELDQAVCSVETRLQERLAKALEAESFVHGLSDVLTAAQTSGCDSASAVKSQQAARPVAPSEKLAEPSPRDAVKDSLTRLLSEVVLAELWPLLGALQAFLGLIKGPASKDAHEGESSKPPSLPSELIDAIAYVDAGMATLEQVSKCAAACEDLLRAHVRPPLSKAHAYLSGEARGRSSGWAPSLLTGRKKRPQAGDSSAQAEKPEQIWQDLQRALGGLDWILRKIAGTELAASRAEEGGKAWEEGVAPIVLQAACGGAPLVALQSSEEGAPPQRATQELSSKGTVQVTAALLQLSLHLKQTRALAGSLQAASQGLDLRALAQAQAAAAKSSLTKVAKDSLTEVAKDSLAAGRKALLEAVKDRVREMTVKAQGQLADWADRSTGDLGDAVTSALGDTCGALLAPALGLLGEVVKGRTNKLTAHTWQVREVAILGALRALDALRHDAAALQDGAATAKGSAQARLQATIRAVRKELQAAVLVRLSLERSPSAQALQRHGEALATELNAPLRAVCDFGAQGGDGDALLANGLKDVGGTLEELRKAMEKLAAIERHEAWAQAQHVVRQTIDAQLLELEEAQKAVAREPDLLQKQLLLVRCRDVHTALAQSSRNVEDIGTGLGVVVGFLTTVNDKLDVVNESLNELQSSVRELGADMKRMVGRPVLEELAEQRSKQLAQCQELRREVYIATDGVGPGDDGKFLATDNNMPKDLLEAVKTELLESEKVSLLLLSGPAGSGKSTFVRHLEVYLEMEYMKQTQGEHAEVVLVKVSLPALRNPMADLFHEALARGYGLREAQIHDLRDLARAGKVRLIFLLDAYDELPNQCLFKNLYMSNNLEQYRDQSKGAAPSAYPKVIITTRTELLSRDPEYARAFVPMEMDHTAGSSVKSADVAFLELRIAPFDSKVDRYIHAKVALEVRGELERHVGALAALSKEAASELMKKAAGVLLSPDSAEASSDIQDMLEAACAAVTAPGVGKEEPLERVRWYMTQVPMVPPVQPLFHVVWVLAGALAEASSGLKQTLEDFCDGLARADTGKIWLHRDYRKAFDAIPELQELTTTPFMVEIVTEILPKLQELQSTDASMKEKLLLLLNEDAAQMVWGCIGRWRGADDSILKQAQAGLEDESSQAPAPGAVSVTELAKEVVTVLKGQGLLLKQDKLAGIGWEQLQAMGRVSARGTTKGQAGGAHTRMADGVSTDSLILLGGDDAELDRLLHEMVQEVVSEEEDKLLEEAISQTGILYLLKSALRRPRVRRSHIYSMFVAMYMRREASKSLTRGTYEAGTVEREGAQYAQRLALTMVTENMTKVPLGSSSELFHEKSVWDPFLRDGGELRAAAQKAAPVRCEGGVLTFIHKTVQEYLCAASLRANLHLILRNLAATLEDLEGELQPEVELNDGNESARRQAGAVTGTDRSKDGGAPELHGEGSPQAAGEQTEQVQRRHARAARALGRAEERLLQSEWAQVELRDEDVVRDFLVDFFLDDKEFVAEVCFVVAWAERRCAGGCKAGGGGLACDLLLGNVRALLGGALPKRSEGTLLHAAAVDGSHFAVSKLLGMRRRGIIDSELLEGRDEQGRTPLFCAAQRGHAQVVAALRAAGAKHDVRSKLQPSVRLIATLPFTKIPETVPDLALRATQPAVRLERGLVSIGGKEFILEHGIVGAPAAAPFEGSWRVAVEDVGHRHQRTLLHWAAWWGDAKLARRVLQGVSSASMSSETYGADFNHFALEGRTPAHVAAKGLRMGDTWGAEDAQGAEVDAEDGKGCTALTVALYCGQAGTARALLEAGAGVNAGTGRRPVHAAAMMGTVEMVRELVEKGAEVDAEDREGRTALTVALAFGQEAAARALLEAGAGVNAGTGQRPLHAAAKKGMEEMVRELVEKSTEVDAEDGEGRTALTVALAFGQEAAARALLEAGAGVNTGRRPLHVAAEKGMVEMVRELAGKGAEVDAEDAEGRTARWYSDRGCGRAPRRGSEERAGTDVGRSMAAKKGMEEMQ
ncbi:hypothetical protein CYMTET_25557 [Cymbomonas tetramitiformis]|uniref:AAA+ ATPase domain-containing protein n=1 Tax=Cymbomonas tetramitiformis TaxID=36881 RepID=A0AAE0KZ23_9CHLO|nr:hypothetical protein CYMTET_25557 [Cymbomonas tetramitiformis]